MTTSVLRVLGLLVVLHLHAFADSAPWTNGVTPAQQARANQLFAEGNELFGRLAHGPALEKYRAAVAIWDHPMLHFNMAVALIKLERFLEASESLDRALRWGSAPFTSELYGRAMTYRAFVDSKLGMLEVHCTHDDVRVSVDGAAWFSCPGKAQRRLAPGEHLVVGELGSEVVMSVRVAIAAGEVQREEVSVRARPVGRFEYPAPRWLPWAVVAVGTLAAGTGLVLRELADRDIDAIRDDVARSCPPSCDDVWSDRRSEAQSRNRLGSMLAISGGAIAVSSLVWAIVNRPRHVDMPDVEVIPATNGGVARARWSF